VVPVGRAGSGDEADEDDRTVVTWSMTVKQNLITKAVHLFLSTDRMAGGNFETGLARRRSVVEGASRR
jgi:hypothetical protein